MTRTAVRGGPVPPSARTGLHDLDDGELLDLVRSEPIGSALRSDSCEVLVRRHEALVRSCVLRYSGTPESAEELMQVGYVGLLKAINNFDPAFGGSLAAYAQPCISGEVKRHFRDRRWQVRVKRSAQELLLEARQASADLAQQLGRAPADTELARHLGVSDADLLDARRADLFFHAPSLDAPVPRHGRHGPAGRPARRGRPPAGAGGGHGRGQRALDRAPARERRILLMRFYGNMTQAEIGARLGISQMHVSRLQAAALSYLRDRLLGPDPAAPPSPPSGSTLTQTRRQA